MKKILLIAFHYPPFKGSSGLHRTLSFSKYLPEYGWHPIVLSAKSIAYENISSEFIDEIEGKVEVHRAFGMDTGRDFSLCGKYPSFLSLPDKWVSWWFGAVLTGIRIIKKQNPDLIWSTYPIATAHLIALTLNKLLGVPWIADFRDSMTEEKYPIDPLVRKTYRWIEKKTINHCRKAIFTAPGAIEMYRKRFPHVPDNRWGLIENGVDDMLLDKASQQAVKRPGKQIVFLHSGLLYREERNPIQFFKAVAGIKKEGFSLLKNACFIFRASGNEIFYEKLIKDYEIDDFIKFLPPVSYQKALEEMLNADCLLIFQGRSCNHQIPAKIYEYILTGRPIIAFTEYFGDTARLLQNHGYSLIAPLDSVEKIQSLIKRFLFAYEKNRISIQSPKLNVTRKYRTEQLTEILNRTLLKK